MPVCLVTVVQCSQPRSLCEGVNCIKYISVALKLKPVYWELLWRCNTVVVLVARRRDLHRRNKTGA